MSDPEKGGFRKYGDFERALGYGDKRFQSSSRVRRLNREEMEFAEKVREHLDAKASVLDIPCGNGRFFETFKNSSSHHLFDFAPTMVEAIKAKFPEAAHCDVREADVTDIPLEDNSVDLAFCMRLFHHMETDEIRLKALKDLARVSKQFVAVTYYCSDCWRYWKKKLRGKQPSGFGIPRKHFLKLASEAQLEVVFEEPRFRLSEQQRNVLFRKMTGWNV